MIRGISVYVLNTTLAVGLAASMPALAQAQTPIPQVYSFTEDPGISFAGPTVVTVSRDGSKEVIEQVMPPSDGQPKGFHSHLLYDFQAHQIYTQVLSDPSVPCSVMTYTSTTAPGELDVIAGAADIMKELTSNAKAPPAPVGSETLDGLTTKIMAVSDGTTNAKIWIADKGGYPLKASMTGPDGKDTTLYEVKKLTFTKPAASVFTAPTGCQQVQGEASANGVNTTPQDTTPTFKVTATTLAPIPNYKGVCPAHIKMTGTITTDGPGTVWFWFSAGLSDPGEAITFDAAGTKTVSHVMTFEHPKPGYGNEIGVGPALEAVMEDKQGNHAPSGTGSNNSGFNIVCTP